MNDRRITKAMLAQYRAYLESREKSANTVQKYMRDMNKFHTYAGDSTISKSSVIAYKEHLARHYRYVSINSMLAAVNSFFIFIGWQDLCVKQFKIQKKAFCSAEEELTKEEYKRLVAAAERKNNERLSLVLQTICGTGMRISELQFVTLEAVRRGVITVNCKGKTRSIMIVSALQKKLLRYAKAKKLTAGALFTTRRGAPLDRSNVWREMKGLCREAGVSETKVFPHNLRHLFARSFYEIKQDIAKLADLLGHSSLNTTRIYIMTTGKEHRRLLERMRLVT
ncbi:MAG: tyrosine-type recombinase/integrase [Oscillospiraceae bacterium]|nr:tyrosine-type recombinase/integrase [Oscillospiraceae bacterium]